MATPTLLRPQFFHTLLPDFHTHLMIPQDFFSKYIEVGASATAELKSDASDMTWRVEITGRRLGDGWREFADANNLRFGCVVLVRYEGDMVFHVSNLGQNFCEIQDIPPPCKNNIGDLKMWADTEIPRNKKTKMRSSEAEAVSSSSENSCFVALVTASSLRTDKLYLPQHVTSSNGLTRKCRKIVLIGGCTASYVSTLDLSFNNSTDTFYMNRGWRSFCDENGQEAGGFFMFKLVRNGETPMLSFCPTESNNDTQDSSQASERESLSTELSSKDEYRQGESSEEDCSSMESLMETGKKKCSPKRRVSSYSSYLPHYKQYVTFTLPPGDVTYPSLSLPALFVRENGINKPGEVYLLGKDGTKWPTSLLQKNRGCMSLGKGWKEFVKANGVESGFTLKLMWEDATPVFSLCCADSTTDREQEEYFKAIKKQTLFIDPINRNNGSKDENNKEDNVSWGRKKRGRDSTPSSLKQFVTLTITPSSVSKYRLHLPKSFTRENDINKPGMITLLGRDGIKHQTSLLLNNKVERIMALGGGWKEFAEANGLKTGDSFTLKLIWEDTDPVLSLCPAEYSIDRGGGYLETNQKKSPPIERNSSEKIIKEKSKRGDDSQAETRSMEREKNHERGRDSTSSSQKQFVTLKITPSCFITCRLVVPSQFARENSLNKLRMIYLLGRDGKKWLTTIQQAKQGTVCLGKAWKDFAEANNFKSGDSFTMELIWEDGTRMLRLLGTESSNFKAYVSTEPGSSGSSSAIQKRSVILTLTPEDVRACKLHLPSEFTKANGINKLGKITILGKNRMEWPAYLLTRDGTVALGNGWDEFCEASGVNLGESFTLEFSSEHNTTHVLKFCPLETNKKVGNVN
ncbi:unnamed protein product [Eruca vesicaria subsp. sativa]|uniref:TF-B3 domain-containing protein n=1 Tax=Eruca vesicaria subsp. sativa TaxID=29727 RepID=A0ABC8L4R3_ERUVS|nr:unnamed protein product [Eruca vesicaria subsp. sativa]